MVSGFGLCHGGNEGNVVHPYAEMGSLFLGWGSDGEKQRVAAWMLIFPTNDEQRVATRYGLSTKFLSFKNNPESLKVVQMYRTWAESSSEIQY